MTTTEKAMVGVSSGVELRGQPRAARLLPVTTSSLAALRHFSQAVALADTVLAPQAAPWLDVVELLQKAVTDDPEFASARVWLALGLKLAESARLSSIGGAWKGTDAFRRHARESLTASSRLPERERLFIEGVAYALLEEPDKAIAAFEALLWGHPGFLEIRGRSSLADLYAAAGRSSESYAQMIKVADLLPNDFDANRKAAEGLLLQDGDSGRAAPYIARARLALRPAVADRENSSWGVAWLEHLPAYQQWASGDIAASIETLTPIATSRHSRRVSRSTARPWRLTADPSGSPSDGLDKRAWRSSR